jgi:hypothetical protein
MLILLLALSPLAGCVELAVRSESTPGLSAVLTRPNPETTITREVTEVQATAVVPPSPADPTLDDDDEDEEDEEDDATGHGLRRLPSTAR